jgi:Glycosyl hydrolase catalytic core
MVDFCSCMEVFAKNHPEVVEKVKEKVTTTVKKTVQRTNNAMKSTSSSSALVLPGKRGACFQLRPDSEGVCDNVAKITGLNPYWVYTWGYNGYQQMAQCNSDRSISWVPMSWSGKSASALQANLEKKNIPSLIEQGQIKLFLSFNEPDRSDQSNMSVSQVIELWPTLLALNVPLASPACANPGGEWMEQFLDSCKSLGYRVDYLAVHWYGGSSVDGFISRMSTYWSKYGLPILITEFAPADWYAKCNSDNKLTDCKVQQFMQGALAWCEKTDFIVGYSWFPFPQTNPVGCHSSLYDTNGDITELGKFYKSVTTENPYGDPSVFTSNTSS